LTRVGDVLNLQAGKFVEAAKIFPDRAPNTYPCYGGNGIRGYVNEFNRDGNYPLIGRQGALCGNLNYAVGEFFATEHAVVVECLGGLNPRWAFYFLRIMNLNQYATATAQPGLSVKVIDDLVIPVPPLREQERIVTSIESAFAVIDEVEQAKDDLKSAVASAKAKVLALAISGKLVPQDPNDEPASALLDRIQSEREQLIKDGKIRRPRATKTTPASGDSSHYENLPFTVPESWTWAKVSDICEPQETKKPSGDFFRYIDIDAIDNRQHRVTEPKLVATTRAPSRAAKGVQSGDTLFSMVRPYLENIAFVTDDLSDCIASTGFYVCRPIPAVVSPNYLFRFFVSDYAITGINAFMRGDNSPAIRKDEMDSFLVPLPPLDEQQRIASAVESAFTNLDIIISYLN